MLGAIHVTPLHRVLVDVIQFLAHDRFGENQFGVKALLPKLMFPVLLVGQFGKAQSVQQTFDLARHQP